VGGEQLVAFGEACTSLASGSASGACGSLAGALTVQNPPKVEGATRLVEPR
jgi:hypothetical protein